jgi:hypothetical protein
MAGRGWADGRQGVGRRQAWGKAGRMWGEGRQGWGEGRKGRGKGRQGVGVGQAADPGRLVTKPFTFL